MLRKLYYCCIIFFSIVITTVVKAQIDRLYEPVILRGDVIPASFYSEVENLYLASYHEVENNWEIIPFQIDEVDTTAGDSMKYFVFDNGILDADDEIVFMASDLGDKADTTKWLDGASPARLEIKFTDPLDERKGYIYLYYSPAQFYDIPATYQMDYDNQNDRIHSKNYELGFIEKTGTDINSTGLLNDVIIKDGLNTDIFDRMKIRAFGSLLFFPPVILTENLILADSAYAKEKQPPVRIIRNMSAYFSLEPLFKSKFTQTAFFYPWSGSFELLNIPVGQAAEIGAMIDEIRVSWDFNAFADGMKFYSEANKTGYLIDGIMNEQVNLACNPGEINWTMGTGNQGTLINIFNVPQLGDIIRLYYHEALNGSVGDTVKISEDSGDNLSYGDNGFSLINNIHDYLNEDIKFSVIFSNFFLPPNFDPENASKLCNQLKNPLRHNIEEQEYTPPTTVAINTSQNPLGYILMQNYPNPFNASTVVTINLPETSFSSVKIYNISGREVYTLVNDELPAGLYHYVWNARDMNGYPIQSGIYFCKFSTGRYNQITKLMLIK